MNAIPESRLRCLPAFLIGFFIGSLGAGAAWLASNAMSASNVPNAMYGWAQGVATTLFPLGILVLNPDASHTVFAFLIALNGLAFGLACAFAWRVARSRGRLLALAAALIMLALAFNNAWVMVAIGTAAQKGVAEGAGAYTLIDWPSFISIAAIIAVALYALHQRRLHSS